MNRIRKTLLLSFATVSVIVGSGRVASADDSAVADTVPTELLQQLASKDFAERTAASERLTTLDVQVLVDLARRLPKHHSAETVTRLLAELERRFMSDDTDQQVAASAALESLAEDPRLSISEGARRSLTLHWRRRMDIALILLQQKGATIKRGHFTPGTTFGWIPGSGPDETIQMILGEHWRGNADDLTIFRRLAPLLGPIRGRNGLTLFLLDGHPLSKEEIAVLNDVVGSNRIVERSRVALGIKGDHLHRENVLIGEISEGGSADAAGLNVGDLIEAIENPDEDSAEGEQKEELQEAEILKDFDDLVQRLRVYREGDVVTLRVIRDYPNQLSLHQRTFQMEFDRVVAKVRSGELAKADEAKLIATFRSKLSRNDRTLGLFDALIARLKDQPGQFQGIDASQITFYVRSQMRPRAVPEMKRELVEVELFGWERLRAR